MQALSAPEVARTWSQFRRFYAELAAVERELETGAAPTVAAVEAAGSSVDNSGGNGADRGASARDVFIRMHRTLGELGFGGIRRNGRSAPTIDAGYVMAALADEVLLHRIDWPGQSSWESMLLEEALYGTRVAGERIFTVAEEQAGGASPVEPGMALAILLALQLGFRGRYRGVDDAGALQRLRLRLYEVLCRQPWSRGAEWGATFADAGGPPLTEGRVASLPPLKPWLTTIAVAVLGLVLVTHVIWYSAVHGIVERADQIVREGGQIADRRE